MTQILGLVDNPVFNKIKSDNKNMRSQISAYRKESNS